MFNLILCSTSYPDLRHRSVMVTELWRVQEYLQKKIKGAQLGNLEKGAIILLFDTSS